ncbi:MAG: type VI secretion system tip protein TssI/VgrG [Polyangiaceae bacterium]
MDTFELRVAEVVEPLVVRTARGREELSQPYRFVISCSAMLPATIVQAVLGRAATFTMALSSGPGVGHRTVHGVIDAVRLEGIDVNTGATRATMRLVPRLATLAHRKWSRIFQHITVPEVVARVLGEANIGIEPRLTSSYPRRSYCVQYQETDLAFVSRILSEEGIFFSFEQPPAELEVLGSPGLLAERVVLWDEAIYPPIVGAPVLPFRSDGMALTDEHVDRFLPRRVLSTKAALVKSYDFLRPPLNLLNRAEHPTEPEPIGVGRAAVYDHHDDYDLPAASAARAKRHLEAKRARAATAKGNGTCRRLTPGRSFVLEGCSLDEVNRPWAITRVEHRIELPEARVGGDDRHVYHNRFECVPTEVPFRSPVPTRAPQQVMETAVVVGPQDEEIYVDEHGRIKVQFFWDLEGQKNEHSSTWLRVAQAWAGAGWGTQFIPRVGMEVLVSFLGGDVDRPVVVGCLTNAHHPYTHPLPGSKTRSGIRSNTSPGGQGYNEISFDDAAGSELLRLTAQRDMHEVVGQSADRRIGRDGRTSVGRDQFTTVARNDSADIGGERSEQVGSNKTERVAGDHKVYIGGASQTVVAQSRSARVGGLDTTEVAGGVVTLITGSRETAIAGTERLAVSGDVHQHIGGEGGFMAATSSAYSVAAGSTIVLEAQACIRLVCGDSAIDLTPDEVIVRGKKLIFAAEQTATMRANKAWLQLEDKKASLVSDAIHIRGDCAQLTLESSTAEVAADSVNLVAQAAGLSLSSAAQLSGSSVSLGGVAGKKTSQSPEPDEFATETLDLVLESQEGKPIPLARWVIQTAKGRVYSGRLDKDGRAKVKVDPGECHVSFPEYPSDTWKPKE